MLLESAVRNCDEFHVCRKDVESILDWSRTRDMMVEMPFKPARVLLQDFTLVDFFYSPHDISSSGSVLHMVMTSVIMLGLLVVI